MKTLIKYTFLLLILLFVVGCNTFEPLDENLSGDDRLTSDPAMAEGLLLDAYEGMPNQFLFNDTSTDDAVTNYLSGYSRMATGEWNADNPFSSRWGQYQQVLYVNKFLTVIDQVQWKRDEETNNLFKQRMYGEAIAMRALRHFWILQEHGGLGTSGKLLGVPYITEFLEHDADFNLPRPDFEVTVQMINDDFNEALEYLPMDWDGDLSKQPSRYSGVDDDIYQYVFGTTQDGRISGRIIKAFQAKLNLLAASPAFMDGSGDYYQKAADILGELLSDNGGVAGIDPEGYYDFYDFNIGTRNFPEVLWRENVSTNFTWLEKQHYPPSLNGEGKLNPSQNLVDAFPMLDGFPFSESHPEYDPQNPFNNRDPRLKKYILYNGNDLNNRIIYTGVGGGSDEIDRVQFRSTRSGYYLKKLLDPGVVISSDGSVSASEKMNVFLRYTDLYLMLAEVANELGGPDYMVDGMSARTIIEALRKRAGIGLDSGDAYLSSISTKEQMRDLVRNERRLELCFEGHRLFDLRRWNMLDDIPNVIGSKYDGSSYNKFVVEQRLYSNYENPNYAPIPQSEIVKFDALEQNIGW
ncbi:RagB/SusD family nutrient uptake outer membrane protein [Aureibaculum marinum]|uniref:RagB/SusD family nutrient uptake outer membrane protein n=1 Tax=Aureibaculum marinum TaxID=2487930 RepID=A0A3N4N8T5_9FLAO|nr:RagB/SusD family nutrient uptake outer membrane protein [Aureibaculum marinum]RPD91765.1 RagB/SusD family nutrient uptake outer membrane protein [Aureibaculum marinum]